MTKVRKSRLTLIKRLSGGRIPIGLYLCECGNQKEIRISNVNGGITKSCGCLQAEARHETRYITHGLSKHPIYRVWNAMKDRCYRANCEDYPDYGGRGVIVCDEWRGDFKVFYDWAINNGWQKGLQIDKDIKAKELGLDTLLYSPERCVFVTPKKNSNARRSNRIIKYKGEEKNLSEWSAILGIKAHTLRQRLERNNWLMNDYVIRPVKI